jgi:hypothetical protein
MVRILRNIENGNSRTIFPYSPKKTRSNEPRFELVVPTVPEIYLPDEGRYFTPHIGIIGASRFFDKLIEIFNGPHGGRNCI